MRVLVACEFSGIVRDAFKARGHDAVSCDWLPTERKGKHIEGDVVCTLRWEKPWDLIIAHPPCLRAGFMGSLLSFHLEVGEVGDTAFLSRGISWQLFHPMISRTMSRVSISTFSRSCS